MSKVSLSEQLLSKIKNLGVKESIASSVKNEKQDKSVLLVEDNLDSCQYDSETALKWLKYPKNLDIVLDTSIVNQSNKMKEEKDKLIKMLSFLRNNK